MASEREDGFYWVRLIDRWEPAQWRGGTWWLFGSPMDEIAEIGERIVRDAKMAE